MKSARALLFGVCIVLLGSGTAFAQGWGARGGPWRYGNGPMLSVLVKGAGLSDAQRAQLRQIVSAHRPQFESLAGQFRAARQALDARLYGADPVTAADLEPAIQQIHQLRGQLMQESLQVALEIRAMLSPEQLAKAAHLRQRLSELQREIRSLVGER